MKLFLVSDPGKVDGEHELVNELFDHGLDYFNLRKPGYTKLQMEAYLKKINPKYMNQVILHKHHTLVKKYNIGGFHFPLSFLESEDYAQFLGLIRNARKRKMITGISVHSLEEAEALKGFDYYFLSPVFDSISKSGYKAAFDLKELHKYFDQQHSVGQPEAIALGGIDEHTVKEIKSIGFSGAAILGAIWNGYKAEDINTAKQRFININEQLKS